MKNIQKVFEFPTNIPNGSVLGLSYSGTHDTAIAVVAPDGDPLFAVSLERISRVKQDGRTPEALLHNAPWKKISKVAVSTNDSLVLPVHVKHSLLTVSLPTPRKDGLRHEPVFYHFLEKIPCEKVFVCHQMAHAASAFWGSGFSEALCLTYDGGMYNSPWFGGLYMADRKKGIRPLDQFSALHYAKVTTLYTFVTALLGFVPNKHEGKITGLAAHGQSSASCHALINKWFKEDFMSIESVMEWVFRYSSNAHPPVLLVNEARIRPFREEAAVFPAEELAATEQAFAEEHVLEILHKAGERGWKSDNICLAGGLFANVKINQRVASVFKKLFVAPPMTDDGTALGAAWHLLSGKAVFSPSAITSMYLGLDYSPCETVSLLSEKNISFTRPKDSAGKIADLLASGSVVAVFQGKMEFGPRALGNRSILAQATADNINVTLNERLNRTEFMPFAPVLRVEDADRCCRNADPVMHAAEFMTVTVDATDEMKAGCPAVVHKDGTMRPQFVSAKSNPFLHRILSRYFDATGKMALVNTSFNIHEEPIVCSLEDAIRAFFESGLDYLYLEGGYLLSFAENTEVALTYLQQKNHMPDKKTAYLKEILHIRENKLLDFEKSLLEKEKVIQEQADFLLVAKRRLQEYYHAYNFRPLRILASCVGKVLSIINQPTNQPTNQ